METNFDKTVKSSSKTINNSQQYQPAQRKIKGESYLVRYHNNTYELVSIPKGLVLRGGGGKGYSYAGMIKAMNECSLDDQHTVLEGLTHISGASAGAMTDSLLAISMPCSEIDTITNELDVMDVMDPDKGHKRGKGQRFRNVLEVMYWFQIDRLLKENLICLTYKSNNEKQELLGPVQKKMGSYSKAFRDIGIQINTIDDIISLSKNPVLLQKLDEFFNQKPYKVGSTYALQTNQNPWITFADLETVKLCLPQDKQHLIKELHVVTTNHTLNQLVIHNNSKTPHQSIAQQVLSSGAHPLIFHHQKEIVIKTDGTEEIHMIRDGGIIDNFPIQSLLEAGLHPDEIIGATLNSDNKYQTKLNELNNFEFRSSSSGKKLVDKALTSVFGGAVIEGSLVAEENQKILHWFNSLIPINSQSLGTLSLHPNEEEKQKAIQFAYEITIKSLESRRQSFNDPLELFLYVGEAKSKQIYNDLFPEVQHEEIQEEVMKLAQAMDKAGLIYHYQNEIIKALESDNHYEVLANLKLIEKELAEHFLGNEKDKNKLLGLCCLQLQFLSNNQLTKCLPKYEQERIETLASLYLSTREQEKNQIKNPKQFIQKVCETLCNQFMFIHHGSEMISTTLKRSIQAEVEEHLWSILPTLSEEQTALLVAHFEEIALKLVACHDWNHFNVTLEKGGPTAGLTKLYWDSMEVRKKRERFWDKSLPITTDNLIGSPESRKEQIKIQLIALIDNYALDQIKADNSESMRAFI